MKTMERLQARKNLATGLVVMLGVSGCGGSGGGGGPGSATESQGGPAQARAELLALPGPSGETPSDLAQSIASLSRRAGTLREKAHDNGAVPSNFCDYDNAHPQPMFSREPARLIVDSLCQPPIGAPVGVYADSSFASGSVGEVHDGDVVDVKCIDPNGQATTNVLGSPSQSDTWVKITGGEVSGYVSEVNLGYVDDSAFQEC